MDILRSLLTLAGMKVAHAASCMSDHMTMIACLLASFFFSLLSFFCVMLDLFLFLLFFFPCFMIYLVAFLILRYVPMGGLHPFSLSFSFTFVFLRVEVDAYSFFKIQILRFLKD